MATRPDEVDSNLSTLEIHEPHPWFGVRVDDYTFSGHAIRDVFAVLQLAQTIEPDPQRLMTWYRNTRIMKLDDLTAEKLVCLGRASEVIGFLKSILRGVGH
jgi:hypothetical protein